MKLETPPGTRDFLPEEMIGRQETIEKIRSVFEVYGFSPSETPAFEYAELLEGKYGEEEKLIYKFEDMGGRKLALRYDLTVPLVRLFGSNALTTPFKRYCIARVWRFDRPQKGRYREFWQCDVDIVGSKSMMADAEVVACAIDALEAVGLKEFKFKINNRKLLDAIMKKVGIPEGKELEAFRALDKLEKFGVDQVRKEFKERGIDAKKGAELLEFLKLGDLGEIEKNIGGNEGINELREILDYLKAVGKDKRVLVDLSMARGLDYYTGPIFEVEEGSYGSIAGGGRYDNLIKRITGKDAPATGISLGIERILEVLKEKGVIKDRKTLAQVYVLCVDDESKKEALQIVDKLRTAGIPTETDVVGRNFSNQLKYVDKQGVKRVIIVGQKDLKEGKVTIKNMESGEQKMASLKDVVGAIK
ncbi:MAG: histidine--tRNA ligase [Candidatus Altiarchaeota archaeon]|nr:histidine--tRNA ligase [Candidatus Altiarchaeota archaeon]